MDLVLDSIRGEFYKLGLRIVTGPEIVFHGVMKRQRAHSLAELADMPPLTTKEGYKTGLALELRLTDVVITPFGKSGTTWTQQIVHTLRTRGDMDFDDISRVVPWIETSVDLGIDLDAEQRANPRAFKSHLDWEQIPKGGRYINVVRDPGDAAVSAFRFQEGWFVEPGAIDINEYVCERFIAKPNYYRHLRSWWARRNEADVLFLAYEHMLAEPTNTIERIAQFCGIELDTDLLALTLEHTSLSFMLEHKDRFDDAMLRQRSEDVLGLPANSDSAKVRAGKSGSSQELSADTRALLAATWEREVTAELGIANYAALLEALA